MTGSSNWCSLVFAVVLVTAGCGDEGRTVGTGGTSGSAGSAGSAGTGGSGGSSGSSGSGDCARICESPCVGELLPAGALDDCVNACTMGFFTCVPEIIAALDCIEPLGCGSGGGSSSCLDESEALTSCLVP